jgi:transcription elongation factor Elf1
MLVGRTSASDAPDVVRIPAAPPPPPPPSGLRLSSVQGSVATPPPPSTVAPPAAASPPARGVPAPQPESMAVAPEGKSACKFHPQTAGRFLCPKCNNLFCSLCVATKRVSSGTSYFCRHCGVECAAVKVNFVPPKEKEREVKEYSDVAVLLRSIGFAFGAALIAGTLWDVCVWLTSFEAPPIFAVATGALCGYAVKIASQDRPGVIFSSIAVFFTLLGIAVAKVIGFFMLPLYTISGLIYMTVGVVAALFIAWRVGGGDF